MKRSVLFFALMFIMTAGTAFRAGNGDRRRLLDRNGNGLHDAGEPGIPNAGVSNGSAVVQTGSDGRYSIPVGDDNVIFVIKPAAYNIPVNGDNVPQFYYIHKPNGSPEGMEYAGVEPTGPLPSSVDFRCSKAATRTNSAPSSSATPSRITYSISTTSAGTSCRN